MKKFAVTVEPDGGRPEPTGAIYLIGQISRQPILPDKRSTAVSCPKHASMRSCPR